MNKTFSDLYLEYCSSQTDAPAVFHSYLAYTIVSSVINKKCFFEFGHQKLYPNIFLLIVAPSSAHRKSWSLSIANKFIRSVYPDFIIGEVSSREAFLQELADSNRIPDGSGIIEIDELKGFMDRVKSKHHMEGFLQDLSTMYDHKYFSRRIGVKEKDVERVRVEEPFLNIMAACSNEWLYESIQQGDISGGFLARFVWVIHNDPAINLSSRPKPPNKEIYDQLILKLHRLKEFIGEFRFDADSDAFYDKWYATFYANHQGGRWDANYHRAAAHVIKLSCLEAAMRQEASSPDIICPNPIYITVSDLKKAILIVQDTLLGLNSVTVGVNGFDVIYQKVLKFVEKHENVTRRQILQNVRGLSAKLLSDILTTLEQSESVKIEKSGGGIRVFLNSNHVDENSLN